MDYFIKHHIRSITLQSNKLIIEFNNSQTETKEANEQDLQPIYSYLQKQNLTSLSLKDLQKTNPNTQQSFNWTPWLIGGGIILILIILGIIAYSLNKKKKYDEKV